MFRLILNGFIIGLGKILPGVSGAILAISLGVYEKSIEAINNIFNKKSIQYLTCLSIGLGISIVFFSNIILYFVNNYYFWTMLLFIGLIIGGLKEITTEIIDKITIKNILIALIPILLMIILNNVNINITNYSFFTLMLLGFIELISMIIPGVSGTSIHLMLGTYNHIMTMFSKIIIVEIIPFIIGMILSLFILAKIINYLLNKYKIEFYYLILGFSISSIFVLLTMIISTYTLFEYIIGIVLFIIGLYFGNKLNK